MESNKPAKPVSSLLKPPPRARAMERKSVKH